MSSAPDLASRILRHERLILAGGIAVLVAVSAGFLLRGGGMDSGDGMASMHPPPFPATVVMWWLMMAAMMLPSAAPAVMLYARVRKSRGADPAIAQSWVFLAGYLVGWLLFSLAAAGLQRLAAGPDMAIDNHAAQGGLLILAGVYQLSPLKHVCLGACRSPAQFISRHWRSGASGALRLGLLHGAYCVGCCWALMLLLFVGGAMNFLWIVALTLIVGVEKLVPGGELFGRAAGLALIAWGLIRLLA